MRCSKKVTKPEASRFFDSPHEKLKVALDARASERLDIADADQRIEKIAKQIDEAKARGLNLIVAIGSHLATVQSLLGGTGRDGAFSPCVKKRCGFSVRTAYNYLQAWEVFGALKCETVAHFDTSALYMLSSNKAPEDAIRRAVQLAEQGETISTRRAKQLIGDHDQDSGLDQRESREERHLVEHRRLVGQLEQAINTFSRDERDRLAVGLKSILNHIESLNRTERK